MVRNVVVLFGIKVYVRNVAGKKVCSTEQNSETLKYPLRSTVAALSHVFYRAAWHDFDLKH